MGSAMQEISDFLDGMRDCKEGVPHQAGKGQDYDRGYRAEYEIEQMKTEMSNAYPNSR